MNRWVLPLCIILPVGLLIGCAAQTKNPAAPPGLDRLIQDIAAAPDSPAEAQSLARLSSWLADHHMIYHVTIQNEQPREIATPVGADSRQPLRVTVEIYRGQQMVRTFQFVPRDNRNLTQLGLH